MKTSLLLTLIIGFAVGTSADAARYIPPNLGRLVVNEVLPAAAESAPTELPVYLDKTGRYFAELFIETQPGAVFSELTIPLTLDINFIFTYRQRVLRAVPLTFTLDPGQRHKTLFYIDSPFPLPERKDLQLQVSLRGASAETLQGNQLRLQLTRKFEQLPMPILLH